MTRKKIDPPRISAATEQHLRNRRAERLEDRLRKLNAERARQWRATREQLRDREEDDAA